LNEFSRYQYCYSSPANPTTCSSSTGERGRESYYWE
jgi:hypothetical protein